jgi:hypothetical protein
MTDQEVIFKIEQEVDTVFDIARANHLEKVVGTNGEDIVSGYSLVAQYLSDEVVEFLCQSCYDHRRDGLNYVSAFLSAVKDEFIQRTLLKD